MQKNNISKKILDEISFLKINDKLYCEVKELNDKEVDSFLNFVKDEIDNEFYFICLQYDKGECFDSKTIINLIVSDKRFYILPNWYCSFIDFYKFNDNKNNDKFNELKLQIVPEEIDIINKKPNKNTFDKQILSITNNYFNKILKYLND